MKILAILGRTLWREAGLPQAKQLHSNHFLNVHRATIRKLIVHLSVVALLIDAIAAIGLAFFPEKLCHCCGALGAAIGACVPYFDD